VEVEHLLLLRKNKRMLPLLPKQIEKLKLPPLEEPGKPPLLDRGLRQLDSKLKKDVVNKQLLVKELTLLDEEPNRKLPLLDGNEFAEGLVEFVELLRGLENPGSVGLDVGLNGLLEGLENLDSVGLDVGLDGLLEGLENPGSVGLDVGLDELLKRLENPGLGAVDSDLVGGAVFPQRHL
tara:strand:- start:244 stop:780 length:537 start_codon:yes stop_codon:yes gene_type:complete